MLRVLSAGLLALVAIVLTQPAVGEEPPRTPPSIIRTQRGDYGWRVPALSDKTAGEGLIREYNCLFTIPGYWQYGYFTSKDYCQLPGKRAVVRADGTPAGRHHFLSPAEFGAQRVDCYRMENGRLHLAWRVKPPQDRPRGGGQFSLVRPSEGPWEVWCERRDDGKLDWVLHRRWHDSWRQDRVAADAGESWVDVALMLEPDAMSLQIGTAEPRRFAHDPYRDDFCLQFGSRQPQADGGELVTEFRQVYVGEAPYPLKNATFREGPEDIRPDDQAVVNFLHTATPEKPRASEGDLIVCRDGSLLAVYSEYFRGKAHDSSPARLVACRSSDGGRHWSEPRAVEERPGDGNVMSVSMQRTTGGDMLMSYYDRTVKGMVLCRSTDEGHTWSSPRRITPDNGHQHVANNACLTRLDGGRLVFALREYAGLRQPYALVSDDAGQSWRAGKPVTESDLTPFQRQQQNLNEPSIAPWRDQLLMTMRTVAGSQYFARSSDGGQSWSKAERSPLLGDCSPAILRQIPKTGDLLAIWTYSFASRTRLVSAVSSDGGRTWRHLKLLEQSPYHKYCYTSCTFDGDRVLLTYMHCPIFDTLFRFDADPGYIDLRFVSLPLAWFTRDAQPPR